MYIYLEIHFFIYLDIIFSHNQNLKVYFYV